MAQNKHCNGQLENLTSVETSGRHGLLLHGQCSQICTSSPMEGLLKIGNQNSQSWALRQKLNLRQLGPTSTLQALTFWSQNLDVDANSMSDLAIGSNIL